MKNKYLNRLHITEVKFREILKYFCADQTAAQAAELSNVSSNSINDLFYKLRLRIVALSVADTPELGELEVDESYFGARRVRGRRGRGAAGKTPVFGILKREGKVYVNIVKNCSREQLLL